MVVWVVIALLAAGRFVEFFVRSDSATVALGLETAQWTSLALMLFAAAGAWVTSRELRRSDRRAGRVSASASVPRRS
jgi:prolipoprotein diacylglyceryltransferase